MKKLLLAFALFTLNTHAAVILQYHHIDDNTAASTTTSPKLFEQQVQHILNNGYQIVPLLKLVTSIATKDHLDEKWVAITFDDGYLSIYTNAYPILKKYNAPFTVFISTEPIEKKFPSFVSWEQLREMKDNGAIIANHGHQHRHLIQYNESSKKWKSRVTDSINEAQRLINRELKQDIRLFAYPYGEFDTRAKELIKALGYIGFGQQSGALNEHSNLQSLPRFPASNQFGKLKQLSVKLASVAFRGINFEPEYGILSDPLNNPPRLTITGDKAVLKEINCYGTSSGLLEKTILNENSIQVVAKQPYAARRFRYNCTAKRDGEAQYYWTSIPFINPALPEEN